MSGSRQIHIDGELFLTLETVAEVYAVRAVWLREAYGRGLFGPGIRRDESVCIAAAELDRVATIVRMHLGLGLDFEAIEVALLRLR